jgi:hypothetical protein
VIGDGQDDRVDVFVVQQPAIIEARRDGLVPLLELPGFEVEELRIAVAQRHDADTRQFSERLDVLLALLAKAHDGDADGIVGAVDLPLGA